MLINHNLLLTITKNPVHSYITFGSNSRILVHQVLLFPFN
uniref:Uncharacterized protein n=1 Tax=Rhizophora mucronata TaxID=61149 RepID=A0A2P2R050_RHIMU